MYDVPMNWLRRTGFTTGLSMLMVLLGITSVFAASAFEVVEELSAEGFYLDRNVSITEDEAIDIINHADDRGSRLYLVVLDDERIGGRQVFAEWVMDDLGVAFGTVLVLSPDDVGTDALDEFTGAELEAALDYADEVAETDGQYAAAFVVGLVGAAEDAAAAAPTTQPAANTAEPSGSSGGGGGGGLLWFVVIVGGIGLFLFWLIRRGKKQTVNAAAEQMAKARGIVQKQVDAIANDILDLEDEVRVAGNDEVDEFYNAASATYRTVTERLQQADTPEELVDLSNDLDVAIWQLDCAEAVLDGKPKPVRPQPKRLEPERSAEDRVTIPAPRSDYQRRPGRRSSYGGSGVMEILIGVAGQVLAGGGRGRSGGLGGLFGGRSTPPPSSPPRASGGSGGVLPGPGAPVQRSTRSTRSTRRTRRTSTSRPRRRGAGRASAGRRRRRK